MLSELEESSLPLEETLELLDELMSLDELEVDSLWLELLEELMSLDELEVDSSLLEESNELDENCDSLESELMLDSELVEDSLW